MPRYGFHVDVPEPFDFRLTLAKPAGWWWGAPFEVWEDETLFTATRLDDGRVVGLKLCSSDRGRVQVDADSAQELDETTRSGLEERVRLGLGVTDDLEGFYELAEQDELVRQLRDDRFGMRTGFVTDVFERTILAISLQMAPLKRSTDMRRCLVERYGERVSVDGRPMLYWPSAEVIAEAPEEVLRSQCHLGYRARSLRLAAQELADGFPHVSELNAMSEDDILTTLETVYGIGHYSAQIVSPKRGFPLDVWSARIFYELLRGSTPKEPRKMIREVEEEAVRRWGEYRRFVFIYVLNDLENLATRYHLTKVT